MGWIGVDLDGTLAKYDGWNNGEIGEPIPLMVDRVKTWLSEGRDVRIFTARICDIPRDADGEQTVIEYDIKRWCLKHIGQVLPITCTKDFEMVELWDDRCVQVILNTGIKATDVRDFRER